MSEMYVRSRSVVKSFVCVILPAVGIYLGNLIIVDKYSVPYPIKINILQQNLKSSLNLAFLGTEKQLHAMQNSSSVHMIPVVSHSNVLNKSHGLEFETLSTMSTQNTNEVTGILSKESEHMASSTPEPQTDQDSEGYILPFSVYEEQTNGAKNLWQLQIWANLVKMHVVEPFAQHSFFSMDGLAPNFNKTLRFGDYFDLEKWNTMVVKTHGSPLVQWEEFIAKAPRDVILLYMIRGTFTKPVTIVYDNDVDQYLHSRAIPKHDLQWINENFSIIKKVCYLFRTEPHPLTVEKFNALIFGDWDPNKVSLIIRNWVGIRPSRVSITPIYIFMPVFRPDVVLPPSKRVMMAYKSYITQYIGNRTYVGIVFRSHHVLSYNHYSKTHNFTGMSQVLLECSRQLKFELDKIRTQHDIFLAIDLGTFGSKKYNEWPNLTPLNSQIHLDVFNGSLTANEREERLKNVSRGITDRGFIAQLERVIATNADCIILLGKSSGFVSKSVSLYLIQHPVDRCVVSICYQNVYDIHHTLLSSHHIPEKFIKLKN